MKQSSAPSNTLLFSLYYFFLFVCFPFIFISWRLITLQYCIGFCQYYSYTLLGAGLECRNMYKTKPGTELDGLKRNLVLTLEFKRMKQVMKYLKC